MYAAMTKGALDAHLEAVDNEAENPTITRDTFESWRKELVSKAVELGTTGEALHKVSTIPITYPISDPKLFTSFGGF